MSGSRKHSTRFGAEIIEGLQEFADALKKGKTSIPEKFTCRKVTLDLSPTHYQPDDVRAVRKSLNASQAVFGQFLGVSVKTVQAWEQGVNVPSDTASRMMDEIRHNPEYFLKRMRELVVEKV